MQNEQEVTSDASWNATVGKEEDGWRLEPRGHGDARNQSFMERGGRRPRIT